MRQVWQKINRKLYYHINRVTKKTIVIAGKHVLHVGYLSIIVSHKRRNCLYSLKALQHFNMYPSYSVLSHSVCLSLCLCQSVQSTQSSSESNWRALRDSSESNQSSKMRVIKQSLKILRLSLNDDSDHTGWLTAKSFLATS